MRLYQDRINWLINAALNYTQAESKGLYTNKHNNRRTIYTRYIVWYNLKKHTDMSWSELGKLFNRNHATVICGLKVYSDIHDTDPEFRNAVNKIEETFIKTFEPVHCFNNSLSKISRQVFNNPFPRNKKHIGKVLLGI
jgi:hypothetical protein